MTQAPVDAIFASDYSAISSAVYKSLINYSNAITPDKEHLRSGYDAQLLWLLKDAESLGRDLVTKNFEASASPRKLLNPIDLNKLIQKLIRLVQGINDCSLKHTGYRSLKVIDPTKANPYASAVISVIQNYEKSLKDVKNIRFPNAIILDKEKNVLLPDLGSIQITKGVETLHKLLEDINLKLRLNGSKACNDFNQHIKHIYTSNKKYVKGLLFTHGRLNFIRVFLPFAKTSNVESVTIQEEKIRKLKGFPNRLRHKTTIFRDCVGHRKGEIFEWGNLIGSEFIFFFKIDQPGFDFYAKQQEILSYWDSYLSIGLEKHPPKYRLQPDYERHFDVHTVLDHQNISGLLDFMIKNVLPVKLAHLYIKDDLELQNVCEHSVEAELKVGGSDALQQVA